MKLCLYSDNHWSQYSSILRKRGEKFSLRLENQIQSLNWVMEMAQEEDCFATLCLGDFFDKSELNSEEISALKEVRWAPMTNFFIAGNHEMGIADHSYSSVRLFSLLDTGEVLTKPQMIFWDDTWEVIALPYILEANRKPLIEYLPERTNRKRIILSHNDIAGIQMGRFKSEAGFSIEEIEATCDLYINGHLHNGENISKKIINIGNLSGQNFSEDALTYNHKIIILDTETLDIKTIENPFAFNFLSLNFNTKEDIINAKLNKNNLVCSIKCKNFLEQEVKQFINSHQNIIEYRVVYSYDSKENIKSSIDTLQINHLKAFNKYMLDLFQNDSILIEELQQICN